MVMTISGVNIIPYIAYGGVQWHRSDIDRSGAGRSIDDGYVIRDRVAVKARFDVTCRPLKASQLSIVLQSIQPEYCTVRYTDPVTNSVKTSQFYSNDFPAPHAMDDIGGVEWWGGLTFPPI